MGNKASSSGSGSKQIPYHQAGSETETPPGAESVDEQVKTVGKPKTKGRARKALRQTSIAVKKAVITNAKVSSLENIDTAALAKDTVELLLSNKGLKEVPDEVYVMTAVLVLDLSHNSIETIHPAIATVKTITRLLLNSNDFKSLPEEMGNLQALEELNLAENPNLTSLPSALASITTLRILNVSKCGFTQLPECIGHMANLFELDLSGNALGKAQLDALGDLEYLRSLKINSCRLSALPDTIGRLIYLREFEANANKLQGLPGEIAYLKNLQTLELANNRFPMIPSEIGELVTLKRLNLLGNDDIKTIPATLHNLKKLKHFFIDWSLLTNLNLREFQDKTVPELLDYLATLSHVEAHADQEFEVDSSVPRTPRGMDEQQHQLLIEDYARIIEKSKAGKFGKSELYRFLGIEGMPSNQIVERIFKAFDQDEDGYISLDEYVSGINVLMRGDLNAKADAFMRLFTDGEDEIAVDQYVKAIKSFQWIISVAILVQEKQMVKVQTRKRASSGRGRDALGLKSRDREDISAQINTDFWRTPEMQRLLDEAQDTFDVIDYDQKSVIDKQKILAFMKSYEGNEIEETLKQVALWLTNGIFKSPELLIAKAKEFIKLKRLDEAVELFKDAIEANPNRLISYEELMHYYRSQRHYDKAIKVAKMALQVDPQALFILDLMGRVYGDAHKLQEAIDTYQKVIEVDPTAAGTIYRQAWYQVALGQYKKAQANVLILDELKYEAGAATIRYLISRASKDPPGLVDKLGKRALRLNPDNNVVAALVAIPYDPKEDTQAIFG